MDIHASQLHSVHFVGIKGVAMTALAIYCKEKGMTVTGSDVEEEFPTREPLQESGIIPMKGFSQSHIDPSKKPDLVIYTGAHGGCDNEEVTWAKELGIETMPHGRALGFFMDGSVQVSIAGSHGKTTTSAMVATILSTSGRDPSYAIGCGKIRGLGKPGHYGKGQEFVAEADEYITDPTHDSSPRFLWQQPHLLVVTNIDYDHPDAYKTLDQVKNAFIALQDQEEGIKTTVINIDDANSKLLLHAKKVLTYGFSEHADVHIVDVQFCEGKTLFGVVVRGEHCGSFEIAIPGKHNVSNAAACIAACHVLGISWEEIRKGLKIFGGTKRRFELVGTVGTIAVYDDYAHHPHEIEATLSGVREWYPHARVITIFQPHTFSRTRALLQEFSQCFANSDIVLIPDIYASAREKEDAGMNAQTVVDEISKHHANSIYIKNLDGALVFLKKQVKDGDIILCMGAGDIYGWGKEIARVLRGKYKV